MTTRIELTEEEQTLLVEVLRREEAGLAILRESLRPREAIRELHRRDMIVKRLLGSLVPEDLDESDHLRIGGYY